MSTTLRSAAISAALAMVLVAPPASAQHWMQVFGSSPERLKLKPKLSAPYTILQPRPPVAGTLRVQLPASSMVNGRMIVRISNETGATPLNLVAASVGRVGKDGLVLPDTLVPLTFSGQPGFMIPVGVPVLSDPVRLPGPIDGALVVSIHVPDGIVLNPAGGAIMTFAPNDQTRNARLADGKPAFGRPFVTALSGEVDRPLAAIVAIGDSITDANRADASAFRGWTETLRTRLASQPRLRGMAVVNAGILGNRVLTDGMGEAALARLDRDALAVPGIKYLMVLEGINDIGHADRSDVFELAPPLTAADLIAGYRQIIARAHTRGVKVILATLTPWAGADVATPSREAIRMAVNAWIRTQREADGIVDAEKAVRDPSRPAAFRPAYDSGDHLHPNAAGYRAIGEAIDLKLFQR